MTYQELIEQVKTQQKELATRIRNGKQLRKPHRRAERGELLADWESLEENRWTFRHRHIAYCELRHRKAYAADPVALRARIESPRKGNEACEDEIEEIKQAWLGLLKSAEKVHEGV